MRPNLSLWLLVVGALAPHAAVRGQGMGTIGPPQRVASFINQINYDWDEDNEEQDYLDDGRYTPNTNVITGIKIREGVADNPEDTDVFVTVPRWFGGVPSTLNRFNVDITDEDALPLMDPVLEPWPSWEMQEVGNCDALQYVQSMEIDQRNRMWVIDTGSVDIFRNGGADRVNNCPPKLVIFDVDTGEMVDAPFIFSEDVMPYDSGFLNDIVIDNTFNVAYITDMTGDNGDGTQGALIVYDRSRRIARRFFDPSMSPEPGFEWVFEFEDLGPDVFSQSVEAVALTPDRSRVFYSPLQQAGFTYSLSAASLRNAARFPDTIDWQSTIVDHGPRRSSTDGWTFDCAGNLFHSSLNEAAVYRWDYTLDTSPADSGVLVWQDTNFDEDAESGMWWTDTYAWDDAGFLWVTGNYLPEVFRNGQFQATNVFRVPTEAGSYQLGPCDQPDSYANPQMITTTAPPNTPTTEAPTTSPVASPVATDAPTGSPVVSPAENVTNVTAVEGFELSPATTYPNFPEQCRGVVPGMLGEFRFFGFRFEGEALEDAGNFDTWDEGVDYRAIGGIEWVPWQEDTYYVLAINSPAGLVRRICTFNAWDNRTSICTGIDYRDEAVTEILYVTEVDDSCRAMSFGIVTTKTYEAGPVCTGDDNPDNTDPSCTAVSNMFVDKVQGVRTQFDFPATPDDMDDFATRRTRELQDEVPSPMTTYENLPEECRGEIPNMLGEFRFFAFRLEGETSDDAGDFDAWDEDVDYRPIGGIEWIPWQEETYFLLAINSPAGLVRRFCTFNSWDNRTATCTGVHYRDEALTEIVYIEEVDENCAATRLGIVTTKSNVPGEVCAGDDAPPGCTPVANMFVDKVEAVRTRYDYPETPADMGDFTRRLEGAQQKPSAEQVVGHRRAQEDLTWPEDFSPATTYPNFPEQCRGVIPNMLGEFRFFGFRLQGTPAADMTNLASWDEGFTKFPLWGIEWAPWQEEIYYLLAINSPAGLVRRFCTFNTWDNRTSTCTGVHYRDEKVTEILYVTEVDDDCNALSFGITTYKTFVPGDVCADGQTPPGCTVIANMFVDKVQGVRLRSDYPVTPANMADFTEEPEPEPEPTDDLVLQSSAFGEGGDIPVEYTCDGADTSFPLSWSNIPEGTESLVLVIEDPDAIPGESPAMSWVHWVMYNIDPSTSFLPAAVPNQAMYQGANQGPNSWRTDLGDMTANGIGYQGMCPNPGDYSQHTYPITLMALSTTIQGNMLTYDQVMAAAEGNILATAVLTANYQRAEPAGFSLESPAFEDGGNIPVEYTCDGDDTSFPLSWSNPPVGTASFVLLVQDPNAMPGMVWNHWVMYNIPPTMSELPPGVPNQSRYGPGQLAHQAFNSWRTEMNDTTANGIGYGGMCPPEGDYSQHTIPIELYALSITLPNTLTNYDEVYAAMQGNILDTAVLTGYYQREGLVLSSSAFDDGGDIPVQYTCDGADTSFPLSWANVPAGTESFALLVEDPDAIEGASPPTAWVHWVAYNIPPSMTMLQANIPNEASYGGFMQGPNSWRTDLGDMTPNGVGYQGMCPNPGDYRRHTYPITLMALSTTLEGSDLTYDQVLAAAEGNIISTAVLTAYYQRPEPQVFTLSSSVVVSGGNIPITYTCDGDDVSPPLSWSGAPEGTVSFALLLQDPDAIPEFMNPPYVTPYAWTHWVMYNIPANMRSLSGSVPNQPFYGGARQGYNSWGTDEMDATANGIGYGGMCPVEDDNREHRYPLTLYALSGMIEGEMLTYNEVVQRMQGIVIDSTELLFYYQRGQQEAFVPPPTPAPDTNMTTAGEPGVGVMSGVGQIKAAFTGIALALAGWFVLMQ